VKDKMKWPVLGFKKTIPLLGETGGFLQHRGDRKHCGIDIYAPKNTPVVAIETGKVVLVDLFTSPDLISYWNKTFQIIIKGESGLFYRYAELNDSCVQIDENVQEGKTLGHVGRVLNIKRIDESSPAYIQRLKNQKHDCMLHLEIYDAEPKKNDHYLGGNWFGRDNPDHIRDPAEILKKVIEENEGKNK